MKTDGLLQAYKQHPLLGAALHCLSGKGKEGVLWLKNLEGSSKALVLAALAEQGQQDIILVHDDPDQAAYLYYDLLHLLGKERVMMLPSSSRHSFRYGNDDAGFRILRTEVLSALERKEGQHIIVASPESFVERVLPPEELEQQTLRLHKGEQVDTHFIGEVLSGYGFQCVDYVYEPGQYALRGSLIDVYSWSYEYPYRIDFFGDEIESIRSFEVETQLSKEQFDEITIIPQAGESKSEGLPACAYFSENTLTGFFDYDYCVNRMNMIFNDLLQKSEASDEEDGDKGKARSSAVRKSYIDGNHFFEGFQERFTCFEFGLQSHFKSSTVLEFHCLPQEGFGKNFDMAAERLRSYQDLGYKLCILSNNDKQINRIQAIMTERDPKLALEPVFDTLHAGFIDRDLKLLCYTDHQLFDRFHKYSLRSDQARSGKMALTLKELMQFQFGDYVVHLDHGIGRFGGLFKTTINGKEQEMLKINYKDGDVILVSIHNLHRVSKYRGKEGEEPVIHKLSGGVWEKVKERSKKKIKDIARDLIKLYSARCEEKGFAFSPDGFLQEALEASFIYEETPDQSKAIAAVKQDMEANRPMDRLVCGDVGFGKTEIAIRAAFKAAADGKQVALLVPTTVLALQHYNTFKERLKDMPVEVDYLSRNRSAADTRELIRSLKEGKPEILIGTHKLIGKNIVFKDLGLLIIDEEQKFGVGVKEKLRQLKTEVDTLTLTATPIPRTLQFSLMGARDLSVLSTPPANRYPIQTEIHEFDREIVREGILSEMERGGQVFFVNNRISDLPDIENMIHQAVPEARTVVAHGQMDGETMERIIVDFINFEYDVLICTSIIENGIDIPNANTIFINHAHKFGLSDLHQLRGRVGRSNKKAYCYLLAPPVEFLNPDAKRRLQAIESFAELGSGLNIAMQDLDIRGAGNLLGAEQSGFIADLGFEAYQRILKEAMQELHDEEFPGLFEAENTSGLPEGNASSRTGRSDDHPLLSVSQAAIDPVGNFVSDCQLESDLALYFDDRYIPGSSERMSLYREMDQLEDEISVSAFEDRLRDRFGAIPQEGQDLIRLIRIRILAKKLGMEKLVLKDGRMSCYFVSRLQSPFYQSDVFGRILNYVQEHFRQIRLREIQGKRSMLCQDIPDTEAAYRMLQEMLHGQ